MLQNVHTPHKHVTARRPFTTQEDAMLIQIMQGRFDGWEAVAARMKERTCRQCRERWMNYLSPVVHNEPWTEAEDQLLLAKISEVGCRWSLIARVFGGRSENDIKNRWHSHLKHEAKTHGAQLILMRGDDEQAVKRKKRNRMKTCPKQNALRLLEQVSPIMNYGSVTQQGMRELPEPMIHMCLEGDTWSGASCDLNLYEDRIEEELIGFDGWWSYVAY
jgi:hypothetical protein